MNMNRRLIHKPEFKFEPKVGMTTTDCYLHGIGQLDDIGRSGKIVYIGSDYFVLEAEKDNGAILVFQNSYWVIEEGDFN